jgi:pilus assembly protein CpaF
MSEELEKRLIAMENHMALLTQIVATETAGEIEITDEAFAQAQQAMINALREAPQLIALLDDESVNDILINGHEKIYIERGGKLELTGITLPSETAVFKLAQVIAGHNHRSIKRSRPIMDTRLPDGSRVNIVTPPVAIDGTSISIRKFSKNPVTLDRMVQQGNISAQLGEFLKVAAHCRLNMVISGGTGSGKTTLLNAISQYIEPTERVVTIEDAAELRMQQPHVVRLETVASQSHAGKDGSEITIRDLVRNALRMRPDRIIVGEVRGAEAFDMLQAMNTGHDGSLTTIHANHPRDAVARLENMVNMTNLGLPTKAVRNQIASAVHLIAQVSRMRDGKRRITFISEIVGMESDVVTMQDLFVFQNKGETPDGQIIGDYKWTGIMPRFVRRVAYYGKAEQLSQALGVKIPV